MLSFPCRFWKASTRARRAAFDPGLPSLFQTRARALTVIGGPGASSGRAAAPIADMWPIGASPPFCWLLSPSLYGYLARSTVEVTTWANQDGDDPHSETGSIGVLPWTITIDGRPYDAGRYQVTLARPDPTQSGAGREDEIQLRIRYLYSVPPEAAPVVEQVTRP